MKFSYKKALVVYGTKSAWNDRVEDYFVKRKIPYKIIHRDKLGRGKIEGYALVIALGGDGTFLRATHHIHDNTPILGINTQPLVKEGFFMQILDRDFEKRMDKLLSHGGKIQLLNRLEAQVGSKKLPTLALNEFYIGLSNAYLVARYFIRVGKLQEFHKSSGLLVSTAAGSYAWTKSAGGKTLPCSSRKIQVLIREPYTYRLVPHVRLHKKILGEHEKIVITPSHKPMIVVADSLKPEYPIRVHEKIVISVSPKPLYHLVI
jgi:NAD kinase